MSFSLSSFRQFRFTAFSLTHLLSCSHSLSPRAYFPLRRSCTLVPPSGRISRAGLLLNTILQEGLNQLWIPFLCISGYRQINTHRPRLNSFRFSLFVHRLISGFETLFVLLPTRLVFRKANYCEDVEVNEKFRIDLRKTT